MASWRVGLSRRFVERPRGAAALALPLVMAVGAAWGGETTRTPVPFALVFTEVPAGIPLARAVGSEAPGWAEHGRIVVRYPDDTSRVLTDGFAAAADPDVSFDGMRVLFAGKKRATDPWSLWEVQADGSDPRQVLGGTLEARSPIYLSSLYVLTSSRPWYTVLFVGSEGRGTPTNLYSVRLDGSSVERLTFHPTDDLDPFQMSDGRVVFSASRPESGAGGRVALFDMNIDGTDHMLFGASSGRRIQRMPCVTADGLAVFVEDDGGLEDGGRALSAVTVRRPHHSYRRLTPLVDELYHSPAPLGDGTVLVSRGPVSGAGSYGIYRFDPAARTFELLLDAPETHEVQAQALVPRREPDGRSSVVTKEKTTGKLYCLDVRDAQGGLGARLRRGMVRAVRLLEGVAPDPAPSLSPGDLPLGGVALDALSRRRERRILGVAPVESDGSMHLEIPADVPVELQVLDTDGVALASCRWIWVRPGERRGCIGCHEDPERTPENVLVEAVRRKAHAVAAGPDERRVVSFKTRVMPILESRCALPACHGGDATPLRLASGGPDHETDGARTMAAVLLGPVMGDVAGFGVEGVDARAPKAYVVPGRSRDSYLVWRILGRDPAAEGGTTGAARRFPRMPPPDEAEGLSAEEKLAIIEWIDAGARE